jgi:hypothetical protein
MLQFAQQRHRYTFEANNPAKIPQAPALQSNGTEIANIKLRRNIILNPTAFRAWGLEFSTSLGNHFIV